MVGNVRVLIFLQVVLCFRGFFWMNYKGKMRAPSLLAQCLPGLAPQDRGSHSMSAVSERDVNLPTPAVEILPSKVYIVLLLIVLLQLCLA